jgi:photosystem II stability/assembly factor-like uncharacterized protein
MDVNGFFSGRTLCKNKYLHRLACGLGIILAATFHVAMGTTITTGSVMSIVKTTAGLFAGTDADGVFFSGDTGKTWTAMNTGLADNAISILMAAPNGTLFVRSNGGVYRSTDNAANWTSCDTSVDEPLGLGIFTVSSAGNVFAIGTAGLYKSTDYGATWSLVKSGFGAIATDLSGYTPFIYAGPGGSLYASAWLGGLYRSTDGATWNRVDSTQSSSFVVAGTGAEAFAATSDKSGVYRSLDNGLTWKKMCLGLSSVKVFNFAANAAGDVLAATDNGVYRLIKNTDEWRKTNARLSDTTVYGLTISSGFMVAGTRSTGDVIRMTDSFDSIPAPTPRHYDSLPDYSILASYKMPSGPFLLVQIMEHSGRSIQAKHGINSQTAWMQTLQMLRPSPMQEHTSMQLQLPATSTGHQTMATDGCHCKNQCHRLLQVQVAGSLFPGHREKEFSIPMTTA